MTLTIPTHIKTYFKTHQEEKEIFTNDVQKLIRNIEDKIYNLNIVKKDVNINHFKPKNKWGKFALRHSSIDADKIGDIDLGKIIRNNHNEFRKGFNFD
jgi:hypothetical protein